MGQTALSRWVLGFFGFALCAWAPLHAQAAATAQGVALNSSAGCSNANLDLSLTTIGASTEFGESTNSGPDPLGTFRSPTTVLATFTGTYSGYAIGISPQQPADTLIGAYAYIGETPPAPGNTAEFFIYYNCTTRRVLLACSGAYGTCPQTAKQAAALLAGPRVPALSDWALALTALLVAGAGALALRRGSAYGVDKP